MLSLALALTLTVSPEAVSRAMGENTIQLNVGHGFSLPDAHEEAAIGAGLPVGGTAYSRQMVFSKMGTVIQCRDMDTPGQVPLGLDRSRAPKQIGYAVRIHKLD